MVDRGSFVESMCDWDAFLQRALPETTVMGGLTGYVLISWAF